MKTFNVQGTVLANVFAPEISAENEEEAVKIFKNMFESVKLVDWAKWSNNIEVHESNLDKINKVLKKMGLDKQYQVDETPKQIYDYGDFCLFSVSFKVLHNDVPIAFTDKVYFIVLANGDLLLPIKQSLESNQEISFSYMNIVFDSNFVDSTFFKQLAKVFFTDGEDVVAYTPTSNKIGFFAVYKENGEQTSLGKRVNYIIKKTGINGLYVTNSSIYDLELRSWDGKIDLSASYKSEFGYIPERLTKIESII